MSEATRNEAVRAGGAPDAPQEGGARLEDQYRELVGLVGGLAHEIRNPLSTIRMNVQLLAEELAAAPSPPEKRVSARIETVRRECDRLSQVLDDFLRFARVGELELSMESLNEVVEEMVEFSRPRVESKGLVLREDLRDDLPPVRLDRDAFKQALLNLMLNAEAAMSARGGELMLRTHYTGGEAVLDVIDTGPGISPGVLSKIFQPFFSTRAEGTGLGLPTTKRIVEAHGGRITVDSEPGKGTAFHVHLPPAP
jgi:signal transduction histidine kinase